jgi:hypothetical protein
LAELIDAELLVPLRARQQPGHGMECPRLEFDGQLLPATLELVLIPDCFERR